MKYLFIATVIGLVIGCGAPPSVQTPAGRIAYKADQVVNYLGVFQDAAIGAESQHLMTEPATRLVVTFVKSSVTTIAQSPNGWRPTVIAALDELVKNLPKSDVDKFATYINLLRTIIASS